MAWKVVTIFYEDVPHMAQGLPFEVALPLSDQQHDHVVARFARRKDMLEYVNLLVPQYEGETDAGN